jgi:hypothetical protein
MLGANTDRLPVDVALYGSPGDTQRSRNLRIVEPLVYDELRRLAAQKLSHEKPGQTLQATALVHEAYIRLVDDEKAQH